MGKWTQVTEKDFRQVKLLTDAGISTSKISEITKRSWTTIKRMQDAENIETYRERVKEYNQSSKKPVSGKPVEAVESHNVEVVVKLLRDIEAKVDKLLALINIYGR